MSCDANLYISDGAGRIFTLLFEFICVVVYEDCTLAYSLKEVMMFQACRNPKCSFDQLWFDAGGFCTSDHSKVVSTSTTSVHYLKDDFSTATSTWSCRKILGFCNFISHSTEEQSSRTAAVQEYLMLSNIYDLSARWKSLDL